VNPSSQVQTPESSSHKPRFEQGARLCPSSVPETSSAQASPSGQLAVQGRSQPNEKAGEELKTLTNGAVRAGPTVRTLAQPLSDTEATTGAVVRARVAVSDWQPSGPQQPRGCNQDEGARAGGTKRPHRATSEQKESSDSTGSAHRNSSTEQEASAAVNLVDLQAVLERLRSSEPHDVLDVLHSHRSQLRGLCCAVRQHLINVLLVRFVLLDALSDGANPTPRQQEM
jgi:hypothetical protein